MNKVYVYNVAVSILLMADSPLPYLHRSHIKELSKKSSSYVLVNYFEAHNINGLVIYTLLTIILFVKQMQSTQMFQ